MIDTINHYFWYILVIKRLVNIYIICSSVVYINIDILSYWWILYFLFTFDINLPKIGSPCKIDIFYQAYLIKTLINDDIYMQSIIFLANIVVIKRTMKLCNSIVVYINIDEYCYFLNINFIVYIYNCVSYVHIW